MKKLLKLTVLLSIALFIQSCNNTKKKNDWDSNGLKGKVMSYTEISYEAVERFGEIEEGSRERRNFWEYDTQVKFNQDGNKIERNKYNSDGSLVSKYTYKYDDKGNNIEVSWYNSDGSLINKYTYKYDDKRNKIEENEYNSDGGLRSKYTFKYEYDSHYNWIKKTEFKDNKPKYILKREYEYFN